MSIKIIFDIALLYQPIIIYNYVKIDFDMQVFHILNNKFIKIYTKYFDIILPKKYTPLHICISKIINNPKTTPNYIYKYVYENYFNQNNYNSSMNQFIENNLISVDKNDADSHRIVNQSECQILSNPNYLNNNDFDVNFDIDDEKNPHDVKNVCIYKSHIDKRKLFNIVVTLVTGKQYYMPYENDTFVCLLKFFDNKIHIVQKYFKTQINKKKIINEFLRKLILVCSKFHVTITFNESVFKMNDNKIFKTIVLKNKPKIYESIFPLNLLHLI
jgi:hypothetical protein